MVDMRAESRVMYLMHYNAWTTGSLQSRHAVSNGRFLLDGDYVWLLVN